MSGHAMKANWRIRGKNLCMQAGAIVRSPKWLRRATWALCAWLLLWALLYVTVPLMLKSQIENRFGKARPTGHCGADRLQALVA